MGFPGDAVPACWEKWYTKKEVFFQIFMRTQPEQYSAGTNEWLGRTDEGKQDSMPPQYGGMTAEAVEEIWTVPEYADPEKTVREKERKEKALAYLRHREKEDAERQTELASARSQQDSEDALRISEVRSKLGLEKETSGEESTVVQECRESVANIMRGKSPDKADAYRMALDMMLTMRSEFVQMKKEAGGDMLTLGHAFKKEMQTYRDDFLAHVCAETERGGMQWESNPGWLGINTRPEASRKDGLNYKAYLTVPSEEYAFVQHIPELAKRLRKLAIDTDDKVQIKIPNGFMAFVAHNDSIVVHCKKRENAEAALAIVREWMGEYGIHEAPRELGRTQIAADGTSESFTQMVTKNIGQWLAQNEGKYDGKLLAEEAIRYAIAYSQKPPNFTEANKQGAS